VALVRTGSHASSDVKSARGCLYFHRKTYERCLYTTDVVGEKHGRDIRGLYTVTQYTFIRFDGFSNRAHWRYPSAGHNGVSS